MNPPLTFVADVSGFADWVGGLALVISIVLPLVLCLALVCGGISLFARRLRAAHRRGVYLGGRNAV